MIISSSNLNPGSNTDWLTVALMEYNQSSGCFDQGRRLNDYCSIDNYGKSFESRETRFYRYAVVKLSFL